MAQRGRPRKEVAALRGENAEGEAATTVTVIMDQCMAGTGLTLEVGDEIDVREEVADAWKAAGIAHPKADEA